MKKVFSLVLILSSIIFAQSVGYKSLNELKQQAAALDQKTLLSGKEDLTLYTPQNNFSKKSPGLAILYSLLVPGMGELYAGGYDSGKYFTIADGALWSVFTGFTVYGNWKKNDYLSFARAKGGVTTDGKDDEYFALISGYLSIDEYNKEKEFERDFVKVFKTDTHYWNWNTNENRSQYRDMWSSSESAFNNVRFVVGALILNRIVSAINAVRLVTKYNNQQQEEIAWNVYFSYENKFTLPSSINLNITTKF